MIATLLAMLAIQAQPAVTLPRPVQIAPPTTTWQPTKKQQMIADGRALVLRAERLSATYTPAAGLPSQAELKAAIDQMKAEIDSLSGWGEMTSLRMQKYSDRYQKAYSALTSIMKKASDTQDGIMQNIK